MANYSELLNDINAAIYENNDQEIDALEVRAILREMVTSLGSGFLFKGIATPSSPSGTGTYEPDQNVFYLATTAGTYTYLGGLVVAAGEVAFLCFDGTWTKKSSALLSTGSIVDNTTTDDATKPLSAKQGKVLADAGAATAAEVTALSQKVDVLEDDVIVADSIEYDLTAARGLRPSGAQGQIIAQYPNDYSYYAQVKNGDSIKVSYAVSAGYLRYAFTQTTPATYTPCTGYGSIGANYDSLQLAAPYDGYIVLSFDTQPSSVSASKPNEGTIGSDVYQLQQQISAIPELQDAVEDIPIYLKNAITPASETGKHINASNLAIITTSNPIHLTEVIHLNKGDVICFYGSTLNATVSAITLCEQDGTPSKMVVRGLADNAVNYYTYLAENECYIRLSYYDSAKIWTISSSIFTQIVGMTSAQAINFGIDGDSVTEGNQWSYIMAQILGANQYNVAVGSACWTYKSMRNIADTADITPQSYDDPNFAGFGYASDLTTDTKIQQYVNNNACTHVEKFLSLVAAGTYPQPDAFIFAFGTNADTGAGNRNGTISEAMTPNSISETDFVADGKSLKYSMCGAMRWCIQTIKTSYPNCRVFVSLPIQRASFARNEDYLWPKVQLIRDMAKQMGCQVIDQYSGCGITSAIESDSSPYGPYLRDGLHPNADGQKIMGEYAAKIVGGLYFPVSD